MAHNEPEAKATFLRHLQYWLAEAQGIKENMTVWFPKNSWFHVEGISYQTVAGKGHHELDSIIRFRYILDHLTNLDYDRFIIHEYDSISLEPVGEQSAEIAGNFFTDEGTTFSSPIFPHPPLVISKVGLAKLVAEIRDMPLMSEGCYWDRWIGLAVHRAGMTYKSFLQDGSGFAQNTIHPFHWKDLEKAVFHGARYIHGIKDQPCLAVAATAYSKWKTLQEAERIRKEMDK